MKTLLGLTLLVVLGFAAASLSPEQVEAELQSYAQFKTSSVLRRPTIGRSGGGLACYDKYIPLISAATANSKAETETCNNLASTRREDELNKVKEQRAALDNQVKTVQDTLSSCSNQEEALAFLTCLKDSSTLLQSTIEQVTKTSTSLADGLSAAYVTIDNSENLCIQRVMDKVKTETDTLTTSLQSCLMNGFDEPQPEASSSSVEPSEAPSSTSPAPEPSEEPETETSPSVDDSSPSVDDSSPSVDDSSPSVDDSSPSVDDSSPSVDDSSPSVDDSSPPATTELSSSAEGIPNYDLLPEEQSF